MLQLLVAVLSAQSSEGHERTARQFGFPAALPYQQHFYPYVFQPHYQPTKTKDESGSSASLFKKASSVSSPLRDANKLESDGKSSALEMTADGRLCLSPLLNLLRITTTTPRPVTCPNFTCPTSGSVNLVRKSNIYFIMGISREDDLYLSTTACCIDFLE